MHYLDRIQFLVRFGYNGAAFHGVQEQPNLPTVLGALRQRIEQAAQKAPRALTVSARTDRGVHAIENYATFYLTMPLAIADFVDAVSAYRSDGLQEVSLTQVSPKVHARGSSRGKTYCYYVMDGCQAHESLEHPFMWKIVPTLCIHRMQEASNFLVGEKDFSSFRGGGCQAKTTVRKIHHITIERISQKLISIEVSGDGFLRKMVRNIVGLLIETGAQLRCPSKAMQILAERKRNAAGITAPPQGLFLKRVHLERCVFSLELSGN